MPNRLAEETSPYLRQHADNPVDWYPWGEEAFEKARSEDKPILLSVGYSACHWCHVMAHESFEDEATAEVMNDLFVNVKVDREERPDVDDIYMTAVQAMTGRGGWPMTVFLTPDGKPFFGGTYFPNEDRHGMPSFQRVMSGVADAWHNRRTDVEGQAANLTEAVSREIPHSESVPGREAVAAAFGALAATVDRVEGGFGDAPKFPQPPALELFLRVLHEPWASEAEHLLSLTLSRMGRGGIYDHLGGGFARYSVDASWLVPHFEKMLYDNALLARIYLRAWQVTGIEDFRVIAVETLEYLLTDLALPGGGFASAEDADSEGEEGKFYVWEYNEFMAVAGEDAALAAEILGVSRAGNFEGRNILFAARTPQEVADSRSLELDEVIAALQRAKQRLLAVRAKRVRPGLDDKVICAWNGLALRALAEAGAILQQPRYVDAARKNARFVLSTLRREDGRLLRSWRAGAAQVPAFLEDHAAYAVGLFALYQATGEIAWYDEAATLTRQMLELFWEEDGFYATGSDAEALITRPRDVMDNPAPSGNSLAAEALLLYAHYTGDADAFAKLEAVFAAGGQLAGQFPSAVAHLLAVLHTWWSEPKEVAVVGPPEDPRTRELVNVMWEEFRPECQLATDPGDGTAATHIPLLEGRTLNNNGAPQAYVCRRFACRAPVSTPADLRSEL